MSNLIALDWDTHELRVVIARGSSSSITIIDTIAVPIAGDSPETVTSAIRTLLNDHDLGKSKLKAFVTIGRGKSELRQLNLPPVPENELPDMVRLQAMQTFAAVGENTVVDFLPIPGPNDSTSVLAAAVASAMMKSVQMIIDGAGLELMRVALRPVAAAALYQLAADKKQNLDDSSVVGDVVMVDLLADDAEIVVLRGRRVMFVRSVRMPPDSIERPAQIAGELRRSLMACGINTSSTSQKVVIWGQAKTHEAERAKLAESLGCKVSTLDPLSLVEVDLRKQVSGGSDQTQTGTTHTGRFAPLIGLLVADAKATAAYGSPYLVDFLNPRRPVEVEKDNRRPIIIGASIAAVLLLAVLAGWSNLRAKDKEIKSRENDLGSLKPQVALAQASIDRTEIVDKYLDGGVIWIDELSRTAKQIPPSTDAILKTVTVNTNQRGGGGFLTLAGAATSTAAIDQLSQALRDAGHSVSGTGSSDLGSKETYRWGFRESVTLNASTIREQRYAALAALRDAELTTKVDADKDADNSTEKTPPAPQASEGIAEPVASPSAIEPPQVVEVPAVASPSTSEVPPKADQPGSDQPGSDQPQAADEPSSADEPVTSSKPTVGEEA